MISELVPGHHVRLSTRSRQASGYTRTAVVGCQLLRMLFCCGHLSARSDMTNHCEHAFTTCFLMRDHDSSQLSTTLDRRIRMKESLPTAAYTDRAPPGLTVCLYVYCYGLEHTQGESSSK